MKKIRFSLTTQIVIALVLAIIAGVLLNDHADFVNHYIKPFGTIFLKLLKFIVVPLVLLSIIAGILSMNDMKKLGRLGLRAVLYFMFTTVLTVILGLGLSTLVRGWLPTIDMTSAAALGVFCMLTPVVVENGPSVLGSYAALVVLAYACFITHTLCVYSPLVYIFGRQSPLKFLKEMQPALLFAFSSDSSVATLPYSMKCTEKLGVKKDIGSFVLSRRHHQHGRCSHLSRRGIGVHGHLLWHRPHHRHGKNRDVGHQRRLQRRGHAKPYRQQRIGRV